MIISKYLSSARPKLLADRAYDAEWFRYALKDRGMKPCILGRKSRAKPIKHYKLIVRRSADVSPFSIQGLPL
jgi:hypothetical protein